MQESAQTHLAFRTPTIQGVRVTSKRQLRKLVERYYPEFVEREDFEKLVRAAEAFQKVWEEFRGKEFFSPGVTYELAKKYDFSHQTIYAWLVGESVPMIYDLLDRAMTEAQATEKLNQILTTLNGVTTYKEMIRRLKSLYIYPQLIALRSHKSNLKQARQFFKFLSVLSQGGLITDVSRRSGLKNSELQSWIYKMSLPRLVRMASLVPLETPARGKRWLPLRVISSHILSDFIQVPLRIRTIKNLQNVIAQINPLNNEKMREWLQQFGSWNRTLSTMYLLGALMSDGSFGRKVGISTRVGISLGKEYAWSLDYGELFCYALGLFGISSERTKDSLQEQEDGKNRVTMNWGSGSSPIAHWLRKVCLGLIGTKSKSWNPINARWILKIPRECRIAFLQGLADGDGHTTIRGLHIGIATSNNKQFVKDLLSSLGIQSGFSTNGIGIWRKDAMRKARNLPMFRAARDRQGRLEEIIRMIDSMNWTKVSDKEREIILELHFEGLNPGEISATLWADYGFSRLPIQSSPILKNHPRHDGV